MDGGQPKAGSGVRREEAARPAHLASLGWGGALGALGAAPLLLPGIDAFGFLFWIACLALPAGAWLGSRGIDPLRFGAIAPALWAIALALREASSVQPSLPAPAFGAAAWTGLVFLGLAAGLVRPGATTAAALLLASGLLVGLPSRGGIAGAPWPPRAASVLLDLSPFVVLGECSGARDMAWHRSLYEPAGTDRFARAPWDPPRCGLALLGIGLGCALLAARARARRDAAACGAARTSLG